MNRADHPRPIADCRNEHRAMRSNRELFDFNTETRYEWPKVPGEPLLFGGRCKHCKSDVAFEVAE